MSRGKRAADAFVGVGTGLKDGLAKVVRRKCRGVTCGRGDIDGSGARETRGEPDLEVRWRKDSKCAAAERRLVSGTLEAGGIRSSMFQL